MMSCSGHLDHHSLESHFFFCPPATINTTFIILNPFKKNCKKDLWKTFFFSSCVVLKISL